MTFTKLFSSITESTVWCENDQTRIVWITMLAMANKNGFVFGSVPGLANRARVPVEAAREAIHKFQEPDPDSRTKDFEGRRIEEVDGGWRLLNYSKHRAIRDEEERRDYMKTLMREKRNKSVSNVSRREPPLAQAEAEADSRGQIAEEEKIKGVRPPSGLHANQYAIKLLEEIAFPQTPDNIRTVAASIEAEIKSGKSSPSAYEFVLAGTLDAKEEGFPINRFFFQDAKYHSQNRNAKPKGAANDGYETAAERRNRRNAEAADRAFGEEAVVDDMRSDVRKGDQRKRTQNVG